MFLVFVLATAWIRRLPLRAAQTPDAVRDAFATTRVTGPNLANESLKATTASGVWRLLAMTTLNPNRSRRRCTHSSLQVQSGVVSDKRLGSCLRSLAAADDGLVPD